LISFGSSFGFNYAFPDGTTKRAPYPEIKHYKEDGTFKKQVISWD